MAIKRLKHPGLSDEKTEDLFREYNKTQDVSIRNRLMLQYRPLVVWVVKDGSFVESHIAEFDDYVQVGLMGLLEAIQRYDPDRGVKFKTYAIFRIRGVIKDQLRKWDTATKDVRKERNQKKAVQTRISRRQGRPPTEQEMADNMGIPVKQAMQHGTIPPYQRMRSRLDEPVTSDRGCIAPSDKKEAIPIEQDTPQQIATREDIKQRLREKVSNLPKRKRMILALYYVEELTMKEISEIYDLTQSRICQIHQDTIKELRGQLKEDFWEEEAVESSMAS